MTNSPPRADLLRPLPGWTGILAPTAILAVGVLGWIVVSGDEPTLLATSPQTGLEDTDGDGLVDALETVLWTDPTARDSDGDGVGDLEELARQTDPIDPSDLPLGPPEGGYSLGMAAFTKQGYLNTVTALYVEGEEINGENFKFGIATKGTKIELSPMLLLQNADVTVLDATVPEDQIVLIESRFPEAVVHGFGYLGFYTTMAPPEPEPAPEGGPAQPVGEGPVTAGVLNLLSTGEALLEFTPAPYFISADFSGTVSPTQGQQGGAPITAPGASIYRPLGGPENIPASYQPGEVCFQTTSPGGYAGNGMTIHVVQTSACAEAELVSFCTPGCASLAGSTVEVLDPIGLVGG